MDHFNIDEIINVFSYEFFAEPKDFFGIEGNLYTALAAYVPMSQIFTYGFLWKLMNAKTLRGGQFWIVLCILFCVPADSIIVLFDPTAEKALTVLAFTLVTIVYGVLLSYYLRRAAEREVGTCLSLLDEPDNNGVWDEIVNYRPPVDIQNTYMSTDFARAFAAFVVTLAAIRDEINLEETSIDPSFLPLYFASLGLIVAHSAWDMSVTTLLPGIQLDKYRSYLWILFWVNFVELFASSAISTYAVAEDANFFDDLTYSFLFGNAAAAFADNVASLSEGIDFDEMIDFKSVSVARQTESEECEV